MGGGKGERAIASYDEDSVSMAVEAARQSLGAYTGAVDTLMFATTSPPYAEKLNAAAIAAALDLPGSIASIELGTNSRMGLAALALGADLGRAGRISLVCAGDVVVGGPGGKRVADLGHGFVEDWAYVDAAGVEKIDHQDLSTVVAEAEDLAVLVLEGQRRERARRALHV